MLVSVQGCQASGIVLTQCLPFILKTIAQEADNEVFASIVISTTQLYYNYQCKQYYVISCRNVLHDRNPPWVNFVSKLFERLD